MRRLIAFDCEGETLIGTIDAPSRRAEHALLIVSGGNEIRAGAHRGMAALAARVAAAGHPVLRFDRRGVGDSGGHNAGFRASGPDIAAAAAALRRETGAARLTGLGNCDAASALALHGRAAGLDALVLANPWLGGGTDDLPPAAAIRAHYARRLGDPAAWWRLIRGGASVGKLARGLVHAARPAAVEADIAAAIAGWGDAAHIILAKRDATAIAYLDAARRGPAGALRTTIIDTASHSFADTGDALAAAVLGALMR